MTDAKVIREVLVKLLDSENYDGPYSFGIKSENVEHNNIPLDRILGTINEGDLKEGSFIDQLKTLYANVGLGSNTGSAIQIIENDDNTISLEVSEGKQKITVIENNDNTVSIKIGTV